MPWKLINPRDAAATRKKEATLQKAAAWWTAFAERATQIEAALRQGAQADAVAWLRQQLSAIDPRLQPELGIDPETAAPFLVIAPGVHRHLRPVVQSMLRRAPSLPGWRFHMYRQPVPVDVAGRLVQARTGQHPGMAASVQPRIGKASRVDLVYQLKAAANDEDLARRQAEVLTEALLGEEVLDRWCGEVDAAAPSRTLGGMEKFIDLPRLRATVLNLGQAIIEQLPVRPYWQIPHKARAWNRFSHEPKNPVGGDYPFQRDLVEGKSVIAEMKEWWLAGKPVYSASFSRHGETLCYMKMDVSKLGESERVSERRKMENRLERELIKAQVGAVIGSGDGVRYAYVDLALVDLPRAFDTMREVLRIVEIPDRSWLLFFDADLADEYVGLRPHTPPPPMPADDEAPAAEAKAPPAGAPQSPQPEPADEPADAYNPDWLDPIKGA